MHKRPRQYVACMLFSLPNLRARFILNSLELDVTEEMAVFTSGCRLGLLFILLDMILRPSSLI